MKSIVFDSWALMAFFDDEPSGSRVEKIIQDYTFRQHKMALSVINAGEIWYNYARTITPSFADRLLNKIHNLNFDIISAKWEITYEAAKFKSQGGISYADCFAAALASQLNAPLVTGDKEFKQLEKDIEIMWV